MAMSPRDRRAVIVFGVVVVLAAGAIFLVPKVTKKNSASPSVGNPPVGSVVSPQPSPSPKPKASPKQVLVFSGRDPFDPAQGGGSAATGAAPALSPAGSSGSGPSGSSATISGQTVVLLSIFSDNGTQKAQVEVDGTVFTVAPGDSFATNYQLVSISGSCANFLHGSSPFTLCTTANK